jgi:lipid-binding SYLF domain-containing protein
MKSLQFSLGLCLLFSLLLGNPAAAQSREDRTVQDANTALGEIMAIPNSGIPKEMLNNAHAVAVIPKVIKGSFVVGARHGNGVLLVRDSTGAWHAPVFIELTGGNVGWQIGVQSTDVVLVFKTPQSVSGLLDGKFTIGADAAVAAGPVGRQAGAATDSRLNAEIYSYSRSRGLFAGVALDGSVIKVQPDRNAAYYQPVVAGGPVVVPQPAQQLALTLYQISGDYTGARPLSAENPAATSAAAANPVATNPSAANPAAAPAAGNPAGQWNGLARPAAFGQDQLAMARDSLARSSRELNVQLPAEWQSYLALPAEVFLGTGQATSQQLSAALERYTAVKQDPRYANLTANEKFQTTYTQLQQYSQLVTQANSTLNLPPPPANAGGK